MVQNILVFQIYAHGYLANVLVRTMNVKVHIIAENVCPSGENGYDGVENKYP